MLTLALTGGIGAGKSQVARIFSALGAKVIDADEIARAVFAQNLDQIGAAFPQALVNGQVSRERLGELVFSDPTARRRLESITHPLIAAAVRDQLRALRRGNPEQIIVYDVPLLAGYGKEFALDANISVEASEDTRVARLIETRNMSASAARERIASQASQAQRVAIADVVLTNESGISQLEEHVVWLWENWVLPFGVALRDSRLSPVATSWGQISFRDVQDARFKYHGIPARRVDNHFVVTASPDQLRRCGWIKRSAWQHANPALDLSLERTASATSK